MTAVIFPCAFSAWRYCPLVKTIIAGGRNYELTSEDKAWLDTLPITEVVCGGATGADDGGRIWAKSKGLPVKMFPADWNKHGKAAGPIRNQLMAEYAEAVALFDGGKGTNDMRHKAIRRKLVIHNRDEKMRLPVSFFFR